MNWIQAALLGILQGLTEFLPVSSSGHIEIGKVLLGVNPEGSLIFTVVVHGATVMSTIFVFWKDIVELIKGLFAFKWNEETRYIALLVFSMIPTVIVGLTLEEQISGLFEGNLLFVGIMLMITALLLLLTKWAPEGNKNINFFHALMIGIAQAIAILPGISRSGSTISTALYLGIDRSKAARFSFLMVLLPILGANMLDLLRGSAVSNSHIGAGALLAGFAAAFISGVIACKWMIALVKKGKLSYFALYCSIIGLIAILYSLMG